MRQTTRYFEEQVLGKRPYLSVASCEEAIRRELYREIQQDGRIRVWGRVNDPRDGSQRTLRVVLLEDGTTLHNAFFDRDFKGGVS
jgi:hypothetical protein